MKKKQVRLESGKSKIKKVERFGKVGKVERLGMVGVSEVEKIKWYRSPVSRKQRASRKGINCGLLDR